jgi:hypothetical protein
MGDEFGFPKWAQCSHKKETGGSESETEDVRMEAEVGVMRFEYEGRDHEPRNVSSL